MDDSAMVGQRSFHHAALVYGEPDDFAAAVLGFVADGVAAGEAVLVAATSASAARLRARLGRRADLVRLLVLSRLGANPARILAVMRGFAGEYRGRAIRCVQELYWTGRPLTELCEAMRLDALAERALTGTALAGLTLAGQAHSGQHLAGPALSGPEPAGGSVSLLCGYDARLDPDLLAVAEQAHQAGQPGRWEALDELSGSPGWAAGLRFRDEQAEVRRFVAAQAQLAGLSPARVTDLVLVVGELAANTLTHTDGPGQLTMWAADGMVICQVSDSGQISDPLAGTVCPDPAAAGRRRGLWLVQQVSDLVQIRSGPAGTTIRVHMRLSP
jgi:anti-sigma regulatory factor (Ser/Thr protein kinase)